MLLSALFKRVFDPPDHMTLTPNFPPLTSDLRGSGGGGVSSHWMNGEYTGHRYSSFMDPEDTTGQLKYLRMAAALANILKNR